MDDHSAEPVSSRPTQTAAADQPLLHVVLYQPEIPQNTGNIGRTCVALGAKLWIVRPTAFRLDDAQLRRAGLDYWPHLQLEIVDSWDHLCQRLAPARMWLVTKFGKTNYWDAAFTRGDVLVFGRETNGLPDSIRAAHPTRQLSIPMPGPVRSLNLATSAGIVMFEAARQLCQAAPDATFAAPARVEGT
jgi:tRNA (cytidine/uridine-2'-O-)-methyltransferase